MRRAVVSCAVGIALSAACTSFSSTPDTPTPDGGAGDDASDAPASSCDHDLCEGFDEPGAPTNGWVESSQTGFEIVADGAYSGQSMAITEGAYPGAFLVHALPDGTRRATCGAIIWIDSPPPMAGVELIRLSSDDGSIDAEVAVDGHAKLSTYDERTMSGGAKDSAVALQFRQWKPVTLSVDLDTRQLVMTIDGIATTSTLDFTLASLGTVGIGLLAEGDPTETWTAKFDGLWCDLP